MESNWNFADIQAPARRRPRRPRRISADGTRDVFARATNEEAVIARAVEAHSR